MGTLGLGFRTWLSLTHVQKRLKGKVGAAWWKAWREGFLRQWSLTSRFCSPGRRHLVLEGRPLIAVCNREERQITFSSGKSTLRASCFSGPGRNSSKV